MLEKIWRENQALLRAIVFNVVANPCDVDDVLQEAFTKLLRCRKPFEDEQEAFHYVRRVVLNASIDHYRLSKRHRNRCERYSQIESGQSSGQRATPLDLLMAKEMQEQRKNVLGEVRKTLEELPPEQKEAIELVFNRKNGKIKDICKERGIPYSTLRSRFTAGIDRIRSRLRAKGLYVSFEEVP